MRIERRGVSRACVRATKVAANSSLRKLRKALRASFFHQPKFVFLVLQRLGVDAGRGDSAFDVRRDQQLAFNLPLREEAAPSRRGNASEHDTAIPAAPSFKGQNDSRASQREIPRLTHRILDRAKTRSRFRTGRPSRAE